MFCGKMSKVGMGRVGRANMIKNTQLAGQDETCVTIKVALFVRMFF